MASEPSENDAVAITTAAANTAPALASTSTPQGSTDSVLSALSNGNADGSLTSADEKMSALLQKFSEMQDRMHKLEEENAALREQKQQVDTTAPRQSPKPSLPTAPRVSLSRLQSLSASGKFQSPEREAHAAPYANSPTGADEFGNAEEQAAADEAAAAANEADEAADDEATKFLLDEQNFRQCLEVLGTWTDPKQQVHLSQGMPEAKTDIVNIIKQMRLAVLLQTPQEGCQELANKIAGSLPPEVTGLTPSQAIRVGNNIATGSLNKDQMQTPIARAVSDFMVDATNAAFYNIAASARSDHGSSPAAATIRRMLDTIRGERDAGLLQIDGVSILIQRVNRVICVDGDPDRVARDQGTLFLTQPLTFIQGQLANNVDEYCSKAITILNVQNAHGAVTDFGQAAREKILEELPKSQNFDVLVQAGEQAISYKTPPKGTGERFQHFSAELTSLQGRIVKIANTLDRQFNKISKSSKEAATTLAKAQDKAGKDKAASDKAAKDKAAADTKSKHTPKPILKANAARLHCWKCGKAHSPDDCEHEGKVCFNCGSAEHVRVDCDKATPAGNGGARAR